MEKETNVQRRGAGDLTSNLPVTSQPTLHPELQPASRSRGTNFAGILWLNDWRNTVNISNSFVLYYDFYLAE